MNILVTGGASGLGKSIVQTLSKRKDTRVFFTFNKNEEEAKKIAVNDFVVPLKCDFTLVDDVKNLVALITTLDLDVIINNAYVGMPQGKHFQKTDSKDFLSSFQDNIIPLIEITQAVINVFKKKKFGKIINVLSASLENVPPIGYSIYGANKAYIQQLSKSWNAELVRFNITSNCVSPDFMLTNMAASVDERILEQMIETHPLKKLLTTEEVAETIQFMVNAPQQMNGVNIVINSAKNI